MLDKQIHINLVDTGNFYSNSEAYLHWKNHKLRTERNRLIQLCKNILKEFNDEYEIDKSTIENLYNELNKKEDNHFDEIATTILKTDSLNDLFFKYADYKYLISQKTERIKDSKTKLLKLLENKVTANEESKGKHHIRELRNVNPSGNKCNILRNINVPLEKTNKISVFDSFLTRTIGCEVDKFTDDFMVVQVYYFSIIEDMIKYGFMYKGEKYIYFSSSAGQIRKKKCVFIKESIWNKHSMTLMCGLTLDDINAKGGINQNKFLAYAALSSSATDVWEEFDIDKTIVVDDFETNVYSDVDFIDHETYEITRQKMDVPIPHMDGCGIMLPNAFGVKQVNKMVRLPWCKGLLAVFDFRKFIEVNNCSPIVKDIYGKEHDIVKEDIQVILTESQFKLYKYYKDWENYKENFKKYHCTANFTKPEEERIKNTTINYQMLQTLSDITDNDIKKITKKSVDKLNTICSSVDNIKSIFGITPYNNNMNYLQKSVDIYPDLINDEYFKSTLREIKNSIVKKYKAGSLDVNGKYTFLLPDLYAFCEWLFMGIETPKGLLEDGEVYCNLFQHKEKLDCLRSPHLYLEHAVRKNVAYNGCEKKDMVSEWFTSKAVYTSTHDMISKILQFDKH